MDSYQHTRPIVRGIGGITHFQLLARLSWKKEGKDGDFRTLLSTMCD